MKRPIYNLKFPYYCNELNIFQYHFTRTPDYSDKLNQLQHLGSVFSEFKISPNTGKHAVTGFVELPSPEPSAILEWSGEANTALMDILLLLSLFTGREVFAGEPGTESFGPEAVITRDPRVYKWGGILRASPIFKASSDEPYSCNIGWQETINRVYGLIRSQRWQQKYRGGYFLFLARQAFQQQILESAFIQCWTIWEHLFAILNQAWLSSRKIRTLSSTEKIAFLLVNFAFTNEVDSESAKRIESLAEIRNRLIHFGRFPERGNVHDNALFFIRLTEFLITTLTTLDSRAESLAQPRFTRTSPIIEMFDNQLGCLLRGKLW
ncbi:MAG: hypothetical protein IPM53_32055 [Anaerolineaceae bacterium]|nr:hypothetical protein [Anaerolineaceae bacterium]